MNLKRTILSESELNLIEDLILKYGQIVTFEQIAAHLQERMNRQVTNNLVNKLSKNGWLVRIKRGTYAISSLETRSFLAVPAYKVAQIIEENSYISFEAALQYHGMYDQMLKTYKSVSLKKQAEKTVQNITYKYMNFNEKLFFGWKNEKAEGYTVKIAEAEKAILDMLYRKRSDYLVETTVDVMKNFMNKLDVKKLCDYSVAYDISLQKVIGFLMDRLGFETGIIYERVGHRRNNSYITKESAIFNAKWRLYYSKHIEKLTNGK
jgi:predicted transcriptional regulator of viral defense system